jgi:translocation and assembly module TamA
VEGPILRVSCPLDRVRVPLIVVLAAAVVACGGAQAFDFFGLWGWNESPSPVSRAAISYAVTINVDGGDSAPENAVIDASSLYKLRKDAPPDGDSLGRRAESDFGPIIDAMWGAGYYDAAVTISIDRASLSILSSGIAGFARAAESYRNRAVAPVNIHVKPGPLVRLRAICVLGADGAELSEAQLPARIVRLKPGDPAAAVDLRAAQARIVDYFRKQGRPLAEVASVDPVVDHAGQVMDVTFTDAAEWYRR